MGNAAAAVATGGGRAVTTRLEEEAAVVVVGMKDAKGGTKVIGCLDGKSEAPGQQGVLVVVTAGEVNAGASVVQRQRMLQAIPVEGNDGAEEAEGSGTAEGETTPVAADVKDAEAAAPVVALDGNGAEAPVQVVDPAIAADEGDGEATAVETEEVADVVPVSAQDEKADAPARGAPVVAAVEPIGETPVAETAEEADVHVNDTDEGIPMIPQDNQKAAEESSQGVPVVVAAGGVTDLTVNGKTPVVADGVRATTVEANGEMEPAERVKWLKHYSSVQRILIVGDGDFSFSRALATAFGSGKNIVATSLDSYEILKYKYSKAETNVMLLKNMGAKVLHGVDATSMKYHDDLKTRFFDRIVFNFPHAGFVGKENQLFMINLHRDLVRGFFQNASQLLHPDGEVHVSHKVGLTYDRWKIEQLASESSLVLVERIDFLKSDYPGYNQKRGAGARCDEPFPLGVACTFRFRASC